MVGGSAIENAAWTCWSLNPLQEHTIIVGDSFLSMKPYSTAAELDLDQKRQAADMLLDA
jgi:hypothetical protein